MNGTTMRVWGRDEIEKRETAMRREKAARALARIVWWAALIAAGYVAASIIGVGA